MVITRAEGRRRPGLSPGASIAGVVKLDDGSPAAAVSVAFTEQERNLLYTSVSTADDGSFVVRGLLPGRYTVRARRKGGPWNISTSVERPDLRIVRLEANEHREGVELVVKRGGKNIAGTVTFPDGKPAAGTQVVASAEENGRSRRPYGTSIEHSAVARDDGRFTIEDIEEGAFTLWAARPGFPEADVKSVAAGRHDVRLQLAEAASLAGMVTLRDGRPLSAFSLSVLPGRSTGEESVEQRMRRMEAAAALGSGRSVRDPAGAFEWAGLPAGAYEVKVTSPEGAGAIQVVSLTAGEQKRGLRIVVESGVNVAGKAVDLESAPLAGLEVYVDADGTRRFATKTNTDGTFVLDGRLPGEEIEVLVAAETRHVSETKYLQIPAGTGSVNLGVFRLMKGDVTRSRETTGTFRLALQNRDDRVSVVLVRSGSPAEKAGIKVGDAILSVDGRDVRGLGSGAIHHLLARNAGASASLVIQSPGGEPRSIRMVAESLSRAASGPSTAQSAARGASPVPISK